MHIVLSKTNKTKYHNMSITLFIHIIMSIDKQIVIHIVCSRIGHGTHLAFNIVYLLIKIRLILNSNVMSLNALVQT